MTTNSQIPAPGANLDPPPLAVATRDWARYVTPGISILILAAVIYQLRFLDFDQLWAMLPTSIAFWVAFLIRFFTGTSADWLIFRRLWTLPVSGFVPLLRKMVSNNLLLGYSGELYFYAWARRHSSISASPFGAIKDVAILSALASNVVTLVLVIICWPSFELLERSGLAKGLEWSILIVMGISLAVTLLRGRLFTLPPADLRAVMALHFGRILIDLALTGYILHCLIPDVPLGWLLFIATLRMLIGRLPLLPNKELAFAALAAFFVGHDNVLVAAMTVTATLSLAATLMVGLVVGAIELVKEGRSAE